MTRVAFSRSVIDKERFFQKSGSIADCTFFWNSRNRPNASFCTFGDVIAFDIGTSALGVFKLELAFWESLDIIEFDLDEEEAFFSFPFLLRLVENCRAMRYASLGDFFRHRIIYEWIF